MKKFITAILLTSGFASSFLLAQGNQGTHTPPTPASLAQMRVDRLTKVLNLTGTQPQQALAIFALQITNDAATQASLKTARQSLATAVQQDNTGVIANESTQIGNLTAALTLNDATADANFYKILSPAQQTTYNTLHEHGMGGPMGMGGGMHGFGRRP